LRSSQNFMSSSTSACIIGVGLSHVVVEFCSQFNLFNFHCCRSLHIYTVNVLLLFLSLPLYSSIESITESETI